MPSRIAALVQSADDLTTETIKIPEWGVDINVKTMDGVERSRYLARFNEAREADDQEAMANTELELVLACCHDPEDDSLVFTDADRDWLVTKSGAVIGRLAGAALRVSGLAKTAEEAAGKDSQD